MEGVNSSINSENNSSGQKCFICDGVSEDLIKVGTKGLEKLKKSAIDRNDKKISFLNSGKDVYVHFRCRADYTHKFYIESDKKKKEEEKEKNVSPPKKKLRTSNPVVEFDWKQNCFICGHDTEDYKIAKKKKPIVHEVTQYKFKETIVDLIKDKRDELSHQLFTRIANVMDLRAIAAKYHANCFQNLLNVSSLHNRDRKSRSLLELVNEAMEQIFSFIENNDDCQFTMADLKNSITVQHIPDDKTIKKNLLQKYGDEIIISTKFGSNTQICFAAKHHEILTNDWYNKRLDNDEDEEYRILKAAGEIIRRKIKSQVLSTTEFYEASDKFFEQI